jgi:hypothetical protein
MKVAEQRQREFASDGGKSISIEEKKGRAAMIRAKPVEGFAQRQDFGAELFPVRCSRC